MAKTKTLEKDILHAIDDRLEMFDSIRDSINKQTPNTAFNLAKETDKTSTVIRNFITTGSQLLDTKISNSTDFGGWAVGRVHELIGLESTGKTLMATHSLVDTQNRGGIPIYIDTEYRISKDFMTNIGVDWSICQYATAETTEKVFNTIDIILNNIMETQLDKKPEDRKLVTIVWDSIAGGSTIKEKDKEYGDAMMAPKAHIIGQAMRKLPPLLSVANVCLIGLNQLRANPGVMFGDKWTTPGGNAMRFHASTRVRIKNKGDIKAGDMVIGHEVEAKVIKNSVAGHGRSCIFRIYHNRGISDAETVYEYLRKDLGLLRQAGQKMELTLPDSGEVVKFAKAEWDTGKPDSVFARFRSQLMPVIKKSLVIDLSNPNLEITVEESADPKDLDDDSI